MPVVMIVDGVLNDALVTHEEYGKLPEAWNDRPVVVYHPQVNGEHVSAGSPDIIEKSGIGRVYNVRVEKGQLVGEIWADPEQAARIGRTELLNALESDVVVEVSTGYFSSREDTQGEYNGKPYVHIDRDIIPDHLALLPAEVGACSVADGCGTRPPNIFQKLAQVFGLRSNTTGDTAMCTKEQMVGKLNANKKLSAEQIATLMEMDEEQLGIMQSIAGALGQAPTAQAEEVPEEGEPKGMTANQVQELIQQALAANSNQGVVARIIANEANVLSEAALKAMSKEDLDKYEQSLRPADYSGQGVHVNTTSDDENVVPLTASRGLVSRIKQERK